MVIGRIRRRTRSWRVRDDAVHLLHSSSPASRCCLALPMNHAGSMSIMQIAVEITDEMRREAESRGMPVIDYVEMLMARGQKAVQDDSAVTNAIERIRALRATVAATRQ